MITGLGAGITDVFPGAVVGGSGISCGSIWPSGD
jgi:hypothetical protein